MLWGIVAGLIGAQVVLTLMTVHRESLTFDEGNHMFAGYMMWHTKDYGLNPEHPPLVKLLATAPLLGQALWVPELKGRDFKTEAYLDGRDWLARNDGDRNQLVFEMRATAGLLAVALSLGVFLAARESFGDWAAIFALTLAAFDPNVLAHSALVTTDIGVSLFFLASTWCFYRHVKQPAATGLVVAGVVAGLLLATKHSGVMLAPIFTLLIAREIAAAKKGTRAREALRLAGAFCGIFLIGVLVLWSFYGFRYAARPAGLKMSTTLGNYVAPLGPHVSWIINLVGRLHLLPESYLIGLVDVGRMALFYPTFLFGRNIAHGVWWYFPSVIAIKTTLGLLALAGLAMYAAATRKLKWGREVDFLLIPALFYLSVALPASSRTWFAVCSLLLAAHVGSSLAAFPNAMAYANEAWGGPANVHKLLSDSNADWAQQLFQVRAWQQRHPGEECWFAYFAYPELNPETYGISCPHLPTVDTSGLGGSDKIPAVIEGTVLVSAGDLSGCEWPAASLNPYDAFRSAKPEETLDHGVMIYRGRFDLTQAAALSRAQNATEAVGKGDAGAALAQADQAVAIDPSSILGHEARGDALAAMGRKEEARQEWDKALREARKIEPGAQPMFVPDLESKINK